MFVTYERGKIISKLFVACFICTRITAKFHDENGASNRRTDFPSSKNLRYKKDSSGPQSNDFQRILPVQVDFGSLVNTINHRFLRIEGNVTDLDKQLRIIEQIEAKMQQEALQLRQQLKSCKESKARVEEAKAEVEEAKAEAEETNLRLKENCTREQDSLKKENSQLREQLKSLEENKSRKCTKEKKTFLFVDEPQVWLQARKECQKKGGDLATHLTREDLRMVYDKWIKDEGYFNYWIGGWKIDRAMYGENYEWVDGDCRQQDPDLISDKDNNWLVMVRSQDCMVVLSGSSAERKDGTKGPGLTSTECEFGYPFLCEIY